MGKLVEEKMYPETAPATTKTRSNKAREVIDNLDNDEYGVYGRDRGEYSKPTKDVYPDEIMMKYPYETDESQITIIRNDMARLKDGEFLNDSIIEFYMRYIKDRYVAKDLKTFFFNSFFFKRLTDKRNIQDGYNEVKKWSRNEDLFDKDFIFIPINEHLHWSLVIVCYPGNDPEKSKPDYQPQLLYFDSLFKKSTHDSYSKKIRGYLTHEWKHRKLGKPLKEGSEDVFQEKIFTEDNLPFLAPHVPNQSNYYDCGVFLLHYIELFCKAPKRGIQSENPAWFRTNEIPKKRKMLKSLIYKLRKEQNPNADSEEEEDKFRLVIVTRNPIPESQPDTSSLEILSSLEYRTAMSIAQSNGQDKIEEEKQEDIEEAEKEKKKKTSDKEDEEEDDDVKVNKKRVTKKDDDHCTEDEISFSDRDSPDTPTSNNNEIITPATRRIVAKNTDSSSSDNENENLVKKFESKSTRESMSPPPPTSQPKEKEKKGDGMEIDDTQSSFEFEFSPPPKPRPSPEPPVKPAAGLKSKQSPKQKPAEPFTKPPARYQSSSSSASSCSESSGDDNEKKKKKSSTTTKRKKPEPKTTKKAVSPPPSSESEPSSSSSESSSESEDDKKKKKKKKKPTTTIRSSGSKSKDANSDGDEDSDGDIKIREDKPPTPPNITTISDDDDDNNNGAQLTKPKSRNGKPVPPPSKKLTNIDLSDMDAELEEDFKKKK
ncbi:hypothetical protein DFA_08822 [Cavenderia fasciculata]|uniref:Ubiquitin-like protease family profile domain-containing protein n=1 Tax=Cavenderia fasciculata TaxID=261658 RepID=F4Q4H2_CACFS|nr:uncharacterized protein DFA_08822 [Cavenderia fasciculata]EGG17821.1 hypothetical protein DFA_08822 [Cavenderia fasciculata]|eukprot:XP_004356305.1 hypothetical protein DFA_08822 [Cavenderia fasciculata]